MELCDQEAEDAAHKKRSSCTLHASGTPCNNALQVESSSQNESIGTDLLQGSGEGGRGAQPVPAAFQAALRVRRPRAAGRALRHVAAARAEGKHTSHTLYFLYTLHRFRPLNGCPETQHMLVGPAHGSCAVLDEASECYETNSVEMTAIAVVLQDINAAGVARMTRMLSVLQPALSTLGTTGGNFRPEVHDSHFECDIDGAVKHLRCGLTFACSKQCSRTGLLLAFRSRAHHMLSCQVDLSERQCSLKISTLISACIWILQASRSFERARTYFTLLTYSADSLVKVAADRPGRFTPTEYLALLQVTHTWSCP